MEIRLTIPGMIRSKKNSKQIYGSKKGGRPIVIPSKAYSKWQKEARREVALQLRQYKHRFPVDNQCSVKALAYCRGPRPDLSGMLESIGDCLEGIVWSNDRQIVSWDGSRVLHNKDNPRTEITITLTSPTAKL